MVIASANTNNRPRRKRLRFQHTRTDRKHVCRARVLLVSTHNAPRLGLNQIPYGDNITRIHKGPTASSCREIQSRVTGQWQVGGVRSFHSVGRSEVCVTLTRFTEFRKSSLPFVNKPQPFVRGAKKSGMKEVRVSRCQFDPSRPFPRTPEARSRYEGEEGGSAKKREPSDLFPEGTDLSWEQTKDRFVCKLLREYYF